MIKTLSAAFAALAMGFHSGGYAYAQDKQESQWSVQCDDSQCQMYAEIRLGNGALFHNIVFRQIEDGRYAGIMKLPLGIHLPSGVKIGIDDEGIIEARLITCRPDGCEAAFAATENVVGYFKRGLLMSVVVRKVSDRQQMAMNYSLMGFTKAWGEFEKQMEARKPK